ncbi:MAG: type II toxin-antitoxin system HicB family antitoxin [Verrucomicrobia bacterium]|nr:type II toxin-antitoxin system HicB family antitoxin [Verrucomicrobiota bacterium]
MKVKVTYWREADGKYLGYLNDYPDHWTQGENLDDLKAQLRGLFDLFTVLDLGGK